MYSTLSSLEEGHYKNVCVLVCARGRGYCQQAMVLEEDGESKCVMEKNGDPPAREQALPRAQ